MSQMVLTQDTLIEKFGTGATLGEIIGKIEIDLKSLDEVVCQFKVNGIALAESEETKFAKTLVSEIECLEVMSRKPKEILVEVVVNWVNEIPKLIECNDRLSQDIRFNGVEGNLKVLVDLIDNCQLLVDSIMSIDSLFSNIETVKSKFWKESQSLAAAAIGEALTAFQKKDYNLMADVLEYDLGHSLQTWLDLLQTVKAEILIPGNLNDLKKDYDTEGINSKT